MDVNSEPYLLVISDKANDDINKATDYFDDQQPGLGSSFVEEFVAVARQITKNPEMYEEKLFFVRCGLMKRFRYQLYYAVDDVRHEIDVIAVIHQNQDPDTIRNRINLEY